MYVLLFGHQTQCQQIYIQLFFSVIMRQKIIFACKNDFHDIVLLISQKLQHLCNLYFKGTLSTINTFKRYKFNINLWTLCFVLQRVPKPFKQMWVDYIQLFQFLKIFSSSRFWSSMTNFVVSVLLFVIRVDLKPKSCIGTSCPHFFSFLNFS